jgi:hypothetical protein
MQHLQHFLWFVGGFERLSLDHEDCRTIRAKYSSIGGLVLVTALLAVWSGGYAIYTIFRNIPATIAIAVLWGAFILWLDRYLISSTRKLAVISEFFTSRQTAPPYDVQRSWSGVGALLVRLAMASLIGIVVAKPIEMVMLEPWVIEQIRSTNDNEARRLTQDSQVDELEQSLAARRTELERRRKEIDAQRRVLSDEIAGRAGSGKVGDGRVAAAQRELLEDTEADYKGDLALLDSEESRRKEEYQAVQTATATRAEQRLANRSVISDLGTIEEIKNGGGGKAQLVGLVSTFLTVFFVIVEIMPILSKTVSPFDPYDAMLLEREYRSVLDSLRRARRAHGVAMGYDSDEPV